ncbi:MAG: hypothetical protein WA116_02415 [Anaerolineaceae bacterium]
MKNLSCPSYFKESISGGTQNGAGYTRWTKDPAGKNTVPIRYKEKRSHFPKPEIASPKARNDVFQHPLGGRGWGQEWMSSIGTFIQVFDFSGDAIIIGVSVIMVSYE